MVKVRVLRFVLALIRHKDQIVKPRTIQIAADNRLELLFVKLGQFTNRLAKSIQKLSSFLTVRETSHGAFPATHNAAPPDTLPAIQMPYVLPEEPRPKAQVG